MACTSCQEVSLLLLTTARAQQHLPGPLIDSALNSRSRLLRPPVESRDQDVCAGVHGSPQEERGVHSRRGIPPHQVLHWQRRGRRSCQGLCMTRGIVGGGAWSLPCHLDCCLPDTSSSSWDSGWPGSLKNKPKEKACKATKREEGRKWWCYRNRKWHSLARKKTSDFFSLFCPYFFF